MSLHFPISKALYLAGLVIMNIICFGLLNPMEGPSVIFFVGFFVLALDCFVLIYLLIRLLQRLFSHPRQPAGRLSGIFTGIIMVLLALQSVGQLGIKDVVAVVLVCAIAYFYLSRYRR